MSMDKRMVFVVLWTFGCSLIWSGKVLIKIIFLIVQKSVIVTNIWHCNDIKNVIVNNYNLTILHFKYVEEK